MACRHRPPYRGGGFLVPNANGERDGTNMNRRPDPQARTDVAMPQDPLREGLAPAGAVSQATTQTAAPGPEKVVALSQVTVAVCPRCGWTAASATGPGARILADDHARRGGSKHVVVLQPEAE